MKKEFLKKNKYWITGATVIGLFASIFAVTLLADAKEAKAKEDAQAQTIAQVDAIYADMQALFTDDSYTMLSEDATMDKVVAIEEEIAKLEGNEDFTGDAAGRLNTAIMEVGYAKSMIELRDMTAALFNEDGTVKEGADIASVQAKADGLKEFKPEYVATIQTQIDEANAQVAAVAQAEADAKAQAEAEATAEEEEYASGETSSSLSSSSSDDSDSNSNSSSSGSDGSDSNSSSSNSSSFSNSNSSSDESSSGSSNSESMWDDLEEGDSWDVTWDEDNLTDDDGDGHYEAPIDDIEANQ